VSPVEVRGRRYQVDAWGTRRDASGDCALFSMLICRACSHSGHLLSTAILGPISHKVVRPAPSTSNSRSTITARSAQIAPTGSADIIASSSASSAATTLAARTTT